MDKKNIFYDREKEDMRYYKNYQKTEFNHFRICQMSGIYKCCKCKKYNCMVDNVAYQKCLFCGMLNRNRTK